MAGNSPAPPEQGVSASAAATPVLVVAAPGVLLLDLAGFAEPFRIANELAPQAGLSVPFALSLHAAQPQLATSLPLQLQGLQPLPDPLPDGETPCWVAVIGLASRAAVDAPLQGAALESIRRWLAGPVRRVLDEGRARLWTVCSGALIAAEAGLFDGRACTSHHSLTERLAKSRPQAEVLHDRLYVIDGPVASSAGITAGIDLALAAIEQRCGPALAARVARELVVFRRRAGGDPQLSPLLDHRNHLHPAVHRAQDAILAAPEAAWDLPRIATAAHVSSRHLRRLFVQHAGLNPLDYLRRVRVALARQLLQGGRLSVEQAAERVGFSSARQLRDAWSQLSCDRPGALRRSALGGNGPTRT